MLDGKGLVAFYDENYNIQKLLNLFKGGIASSIVDTRILFKEVLKN